MPGKKAEVMWTQAEVNEALDNQRKELEKEKQKSIQEAYKDTFTFGFQYCLELAHTFYDGTNGYELLYKLQDYLDINLGLWKVGDIKDKPPFSNKPILSKRKQRAKQPSV